MQIMLGVHGNGLTHLIWMPATPRSAVIELYIRGGFARDCKSMKSILTSVYMLVCCTAIRAVT